MWYHSILSILDTDYIQKGTSSSSIAHSIGHPWKAAQTPLSILSRQVPISNLGPKVGPSLSGMSSRPPLPQRTLHFAGLALSGR